MLQKRMMIVCIVMFFVCVIVVASSSSKGWEEVAFSSYKNGKTGNREQNDKGCDRHEEEEGREGEDAGDYQSQCVGEWHGHDGRARVTGLIVQ
mmetsp:Transcript_11016/g.23547  ORF Transcript_11016/g.23547 Transcript_11016/m.23547 type:complete len:93 (+) Transcript_11016:1157-1435(+)